MRWRIDGWIPLASALLFAPSAGCLAANAGFRETRSIVHARLRADLPADGAETDASVAELLAKPLDADRAVKIALVRNMDVRAAYDRIGIARGDLVAALRLPNPVVDADLRFRGASSDPDVDIGASVDLREFVLLAVRQKAAADDLDEASIQAASSILDVALQARMAYVEYVAARQRLELERTVLVAFGASAELAEALRDAGNTAALPALMQQALYQQARLDYAEAEAEEIGARERLNLSMGLSSSEATSWTAAERLADPPADEIALADVEAKSIDASLELGALRARYAAAAGHANIAVTEGAVPSVRVGVIAERDPEGWGVGPQIGIGVPIFYQGEGAEASARAEMKTTRDQALQFASQIRSMARGLAVELRAARERAIHYKTVLLPLDEKIVGEAQLEYNAMTISAFQLFSARRDQIKAGEGYVAALASYWRVRAELEMLLAGHLPAAAPPPASTMSLESGRGLGAPPE